MPPKKNIFEMEWEANDDHIKTAQEEEDNPDEGPMELEDGWGRLALPSGNIYEGEVQGGQMHGKGTLEYTNEGKVYTGEFQYHLLHGFGKMKYNEGVMCYEGEWLANKRHGKGINIAANGDVFEGIFDMNKMVNGKYIYSDGKVYEGPFDDGVRHGKGVLKQANGDIYEGDFDHGKMTGKGTLKYASGRIFVGRFVTGKKITGRLTFADGSYYDGEFKAEKPHGRGERKMKDGDVYTGEWVDGKMCGRGTMILAPGKKYVKYEGEWKDDKYHGRGIVTFEGGKTLDADWSEGKTLQTFTKTEIEKAASPDLSPQLSPRKQAPAPPPKKASPQPAQKKSAPAPARPMPNANIIDLDEDDLEIEDSDDGRPSGGMTVDAGLLDGMSSDDGDDGSSSEDDTFAHLKPASSPSKAAPSPAAVKTKAPPAAADRPPAPAVTATKTTPTASAPNPKTAAKGPAPLPPPTQAVASSPAVKQTPPPTGATQASGAAAKPLVKADASRPNANTKDSLDDLPTPNPKVYNTVSLHDLKGKDADDALARIKAFYQRKNPSELFKAEKAMMLDMTEQEVMETLQKKYGNDAAANSDAQPIAKAAAAKPEQTALGKTPAPTTTAASEPSTRSNNDDLPAPNPMVYSDVSLCDLEGKDADAALARIRAFYRRKNPSDAFKAEKAMSFDMSEQELMEKLYEKYGMDGNTPKSETQPATNAPATKPAQAAPSKKATPAPTPASKASNSRNDNDDHLDSLLGDSQPTPNPMVYSDVSLCDLEGKDADAALARIRAFYQRKNPAEAFKSEEGMSSDDEEQPVPQRSGAPRPPPPQQVAKIDPGIATCVGWLEKYSIGKSFFSFGNWQKRFFILDDRGLCYFKTDVRDAIPAGIARIRNDGSRLVTCPTTKTHKEAKPKDRDRHFVVCYVSNETGELKEYKLLMKAPSAEEKQKWLTALQHEVDIIDDPRDFPDFPEDS